VLSALGITIGIAAMVAVLGIAASSQERLNQQLAALGTNLLTVEPGENSFGDVGTIDPGAAGRVSLMSDVESVAAVARLQDKNVYRSRFIDRLENGGLSIVAAHPSLLQVVAGEVVEGRWLSESTDGLPVVVLGSRTAQRLGVVSTGTLIELDNQLYTVVGIIAPLPLAPEFNTAAFIGWDSAAQLAGESPTPTALYVRADPNRVVAVRDRLAPVVAPTHVSQVQVSRPSDGLMAAEAASSIFTGLLTGLGGVALLVGGVGVANTMIISVIERRREIGLRRALGARRRHIREQFLVEAIVLSLLGGVAGAIIGAGITVATALANGWPPALPPLVLALALGAPLFIGTIAGWYPAMRAASTSPTTALSSS
jgi:putative ABC transport system permease protein